MTETTNPAAGGENIYSDGKYLAANPDWHLEDTAWKASVIDEILARNGASWKTAVEVGCGSGGIVASLADRHPDRQVAGYDISADAPDFWPRLRKPENLRLVHGDFLKNGETADLVMLIDVFEHVGDYMGFLRALNHRAGHFVFHIPLDLHVQGLLRHSYMDARQTVGHLHYFTRRSALATLQSTGYQVIDWQFTDISREANKSHRAMRTRLLNPLRALVAVFSKDLAATLFGGYSLIVLCQTAKGGA